MNRERVREGGGDFSLSIHMWSNDRACPLVCIYVYVRVFVCVRRLTDHPSIHPLIHTHLSLPPPVCLSLSLPPRFFLFLFLYLLVLPNLFFFYNSFSTTPPPTHSHLPSLPFYSLFPSLFFPFRSFSLSFVHHIIFREYFFLFIISCMLFIYARLYVYMYRSSLLL